MNTHGNMDFCDLYEEYRKSQVVLLPVKPYLIYVYWDVSTNDIEKAKQRLGENYGHSKAVLRFYDVTDIIYDGTNAHDFFDVEIYLQSKDWYVDIWSPDKSYFVDLGFKTGDGFFLSLARSGVARTPCAWPTSKVDEHYMLVAEDAESGLSKIRVPGKPVRDDLIKSEKAEAGAEIRRSEPIKEEERTKEDKTARPINLQQNINEKLSGPQKVQIRRKFSLNPEPPLAGSTQARFEKGRDFDLTEMSEKGFTFGISSELISSINGNNDSVDCA